MRLVAVGKIIGFEPVRPGTGRLYDA